MASKKQPAALVPNPQVIMQLSEAGMPPELLTQLLIEDIRSKQRFAQTNSVMGGICFIIVVVAFVYLIMQSHEKAAAGLLAVEVLAIIRTMLGNRL